MSDNWKARLSGRSKSGPVGFREDLSGGPVSGGGESGDLKASGDSELLSEVGKGDKGDKDDKTPRGFASGSSGPRDFYGGVLGYLKEEGPWIELKKVGVSFQKNSILADIDLRFEEGLTTAIVGPNGSGKSTLMKAILGQYLHEGEISVGWTSKNATSVGYVPQHIDFDRELPMNVVDFLAMLLQKKPVIIGLRKNRKPVVDSLLERVGMADKRFTKIGRLSGGELKRVLLIQALYPEPGLLLLDEPMAALDEPGVEIFTSILKDLQNMGKTIIWVEHDLMSVRKLAHKLVAVNRKIIHRGVPEDLRDGELLLRIFSHRGGQDQKPDKEDESDASRKAGVSDAAEKADRTVEAEQSEEADRSETVDEARQAENSENGAASASDDESGRKVS